MNRISAATAVICSIFLPVVRAGEVEADLLRAMALLDAREKAALAADPALLTKVLRLTHAQQLLLREARAEGWEDRPGVRAKLERARNTALAESWLEAKSIPPADYPSAEELAAAWEARKDGFARPRQHLLAQIFIACPRGAAPDTEQRARTKLAEVRKRLDSATGDFASVARATSEDVATAERGGEIGWLSDAQIQPELRAPILRLRRHGISEPVRLNDGWHILKCVDRREAHTPQMDEVRAVLTEQLRAERARAASEAHVAQLLQNNPLNPDEQKIAAALAAPVPGDAGKER